MKGAFFMKKLIALAAICAALLCSCGADSNSQPYTGPKATIPKDEAITTTKTADDNGVFTATHIASEADKEITGKWVAEKMTMDGVDQDVEKQLPSNSCYIQINGDGTAVISNENAISTARYQFDGSNVKIISMNVERDYKFENGKLTLAYTGKSGKNIVIVYAKK